MNIITYDLSKTSPNTRPTMHFSLKELRSPDGDPILKVDIDLLKKEEDCRQYFNRPIIVGSFYRTPEYNARIDGADGSWHIAGRAMDKDVGQAKTLMDPRIVAMYDDAVGQYGGIGLYMYPDGRSWVHNDSGPRGKYWIAKKPGATYQYISTFLPVMKRSYVFYPVKFETKVLQHLLGIAEDGKFGPATNRALRAFQKVHNVPITGTTTRVTWQALFKARLHW